MGHHFESTTSIEDPRIDPTDVFVFAGETPETTAFVFNVNPDAGRRGPAEFRPDGLYEFKIDTDGTQPFALALARGAAATEGVDGDRPAAAKTPPDAFLPATGSVALVSSP